jgi:hypothetical protein
VPDENLQLERARASQFEKLYLGAAALLLSAIVAYFIGIATAGQTGQTQLAKAEAPQADIPLVGQVYTIGLWVIVPAFLVYRLCRKTPRRGQILVAGEDLPPIVFAKRSKPPTAPKPEKITRPR